MGNGYCKFINHVRPTGISSRYRWVVLLMAGFSIVWTTGPLVAITNSGEWKTPAFKAKKKNPIPASEASIAQGKLFYNQECLTCHGQTGAGDGPAAKDLEKRPGDLSSPALWNESDGALYFKITAGRRPMPAFRQKFNKEQRWHLVNYMRALSSSSNKPLHTVSASHRHAISALLTASDSVRKALVNDQLGQARKANDTVAKAVDQLAALASEKLPGQVRTAWSKLATSFKKDVESLRGAADLAAARKSFGNFSRHLNTAIADFGYDAQLPVNLFHCSMAFKGRGAIWVQTDSKPGNPYLGQSMPGCGQLAAKFKHRK